MAFNNYYNGYQPYPFNPYQQSQPSIAPPQQPMLYGKIVDSYETAKSQDVPIGQSGIYPKADGTAIYLKQWLSDGSTKTSEFKRVEEKDANDKEDLLTKLDEIHKHVSQLEKKIDSIKIPQSSPVAMTRRKSGDKDE